MTTSTTSFDDLYVTYQQIIAKTSCRQRVPELDPDDVASEMRMCLWKAFQTFDQTKRDFGVYWWSLWLNRKADLVKAFNRQKRAKTCLATDEWWSLQMDTDKPSKNRCVYPFSDDNMTERLAWDLLASGCTPLDVQEACGLTRSGYYQIIRSWKTDAVMAYLKA